MATPQSPPAGSSSTLRAYLELVRLPNVFTAMADVAMGFLLVRPVTGVADAWVLAVLVGASSLMYAAGMVLNDVFDFAVDLRERPGRPLPSGRISRRAARWLGWELLVLGMALAWLAGFLAGHLRPGIIAGLLAGFIVLYDGYLKRTPLGPLGMGACRMCNVLLGTSAAVIPLAAEHWLVAGGIGTYIVGVTWFARSEARRSDRLQLALATAVMMLGIWLLAQFPNWTDNILPLLTQQPWRWRLLMTILGVLIGWRCLWAVIEPVPLRVQTAVKLCILSLVMLDAAVCLAVRGTFWAAMIVLLLVPTMVLGRWIYST